MSTVRCLAQESTTVSISKKYVENMRGLFSKNEGKAIQSLTRRVNFRIKKNFGVSPYVNLLFEFCLRTKVSENCKTKEISKIHEKLSLKDLEGFYTQINILGSSVKNLSFVDTELMEIRKHFKKLTSDGPVVFHLDFLLSSGLHMSYLESLLSLEGNKLLSNESRVQIAKDLIFIGEYKAAKVWAGKVEDSEVKVLLNNAVDVLQGKPAAKLLSNPELTKPGIITLYYYNFKDCVLENERCYSVVKEKTAKIKKGLGKALIQSSLGIQPLKAADVESIIKIKGLFFLKYLVSAQYYLETCNRSYLVQMNVPQLSSKAQDSKVIKALHLVSQASTKKSVANLDGEILSLLGASNTLYRKFKKSKCFN